MTAAFLGRVAFAVDTIGFGFSLSDILRLVNNEQDDVC